MITAGESHAAGGNLGKCLSTRHNSSLVETLHVALLDLQDFVNLDDLNGVLAGV